MSAPTPGREPHAGDRLAAAVAARGSQVVLGLDPDPVRLWPLSPSALSAAEERLRTRLAGGRLAAATERAATQLVAAAEQATASLAAAAGRAAGSLGPAVGPVANSLAAAAERAAAAFAGGAAETVDARTRAAAAVLAHCTALVDAAGDACVAAKPQLAWFERLGAPGWAALELVCAHARAAGLLVLADGKRGDVPVTAAAYAQSLAGATPAPHGALDGLGADAFTVNPLLGADALEPFVAAGRARGAAPFVLVRTSNPGASDVLDLELAGGAGRLWEHLARLVDHLGTPGESGLADVGAVCGATVPEHLARLRELMPHTPFLLPGIGAQGGSVDALAPAFAPGPAGGLVTASRSIARAYEASGDAPAKAAREEAERLREQARSLV